MRIAIAGVVCAFLSLSSFADASPVEGPMQALQESELETLKPAKFQSYRIRMAPMERWSVRFTAMEDDGLLTCVAVVNGKIVDAVPAPDATDNCLLRGTTGKKTETVTVQVKNVGRKVAHYGSSFE